MITPENSASVPMVSVDPVNGVQSDELLLIRPGLLTFGGTSGISLMENDFYIGCAQYPDGAIGYFLMQCDSPEEAGFLFATHCQQSGLVIVNFDAAD